MIRWLLSVLFLFIALHFQGQIAERKIENLVFEGAGIRGIAYCGALEELENQGLMKDVKRVAGTSSGAITAALLSVGYSSSEIAEIIGSTDFGKFNDGGGIFIGGMHRLNKRLGWYKGKVFTRWLEKLIEAKAGTADITFGELYERSLDEPGFRELIVAATCLNHQESIFFSRYSFEDMRIVDAVRASMAVPLYFEPLVLNEDGTVILVKDRTQADHLCIDGGFTTNFPIWIFDRTPYCTSKEGCNAPTIGLRIDSDQQINSDRHDHELVDMPVDDVKDYLAAFYYIVKETMNRTDLTQADWDRTISVSDAQIGPKVKKLSNEEKKRLMDAGRNGVKKFLEKI